MDKDMMHTFKCFGSVTVGPRGQVVIPATVRKELGIDAGETLLVFIAPGKKGLTLLKAESVEQMISMANERLADITKVLKGKVGK
jgi:AbrB family looped-hinge helix DNA binding protein